MVRTVWTVGKVATSERWIVADTAADYRPYSLRGGGSGGMTGRGRKCGEDDLRNLNLLSGAKIPGEYLKAYTRFIFFITSRRTFRG